MNKPFEHVVSTHGKTVLRVCRAVLGSGPDADDAWSETFLAALHAWPGLDDNINIEAWLVRVAQRKAIDVTRSAARRASPLGDLPEHPSQSDTSNTDGMELWRAVAALPTKQRLAVAHHSLGGLSHAETAELIGGNADSVRRAAADGMKNLRRAFSACNQLNRGEE